MKLGGLPGSSGGPPRCLELHPLPTNSVESKGNLGSALSRSQSTSCRPEGPWAYEPKLDGATADIARCHSRPEVCE